MKFEVCVIACILSKAFGFTNVVPSASSSLSISSPNNRSSSTRVSAKKRGGSKGFDTGRGGGRGFNNSESKTYGTSSRAPIKDMIDSESAMAEFFSANSEWSPLFRSIASSESVPAMSFLGESTEFEFHETSSPWKRLEPKPSSDEDMTALATFLDAMQQSLVDIPVNELVKEDENDLNFLEEGRRMLCVSRFHVLKENQGGSVENFDSLFSTCWSELAELSRADEADTGSLILLPDYDLVDLRRFTDMNLQRPLDWLGMSSTFEVASMRREFPAIRLLHKLSDMPTEPYSE